MLTRLVILFSSAREPARVAPDVEAGNYEETAGIPATQAMHMPESPRTWSPQPPSSSTQPGFFKTNNPKLREDVETS